MTFAPRLATLVLVIASSGCVRRVIGVPSDFGPPPENAPPNAVGINFDSDRDGTEWQVSAGNEGPCLTPCSRWLDPTQVISFRSSAGEGAVLDDLDYQLQGARHGVVVAEGRSHGEFVNGLVFTTLGGMGVVTAIPLVAVGCSDTTGRRAGLCTGGLITAAVTAPLMIVSIWMIVDSAPKVHVFPVSPKAGATPVSLAVTPAGVVGQF